MIVLSKTCCSKDLLWKNSVFFYQKDIIYELYQKEGKSFFYGIGFEKVYEGNDNRFKVIGLKPKNAYTFK